MEPVVTFDCPICGEQVRMEETFHHNLRQESEYHHIDTPDSKSCAVRFSRQARFIREEYDFINQKLPIVFTRLDLDETNEEILRTAIEAMADKNLGVCVPIQLSDGREAYAYGWRHGGAEKYYGVTRRILTPNNVHACYTADGLFEYMKYWLHWESIDIK